MEGRINEDGFFSSLRLNHDLIFNGVQGEKVRKGGQEVETKKRWSSGLLEVMIMVIIRILGGDFGCSLNFNTQQNCESKEMRNRKFHVLT